MKDHYIHAIRLSLASLDVAESRERLEELIRLVIDAAHQDELWELRRELIDNYLGEVDPLLLESYEDEDEDEDE